MSRPVAVITGTTAPLVGVVYGVLAPTCVIGGFPVAVAGALITGHGRPPHSPLPALIATQFRVLANGIPLCRVGDPATCGDFYAVGPNLKVLCF
jgi:uncharacterized Zn-binding protein involved in type VI secretion